MRASSFLINCGLAVRHGYVFLKVFTSLFSKSDRRSNARSVGRSSQRAKSLYPSKAPPKGECRASARQRGTAQVGGSPYTIRQKQTLCPLFSLTPKAQMKTGYAALRRKSLRDSRLAKKKCRKRNFARCDERPTLRALDRRSLFEKSDVKTFKKTSPWRTDKLQFINHNV